MSTSSNDKVYTPWGQLLYTHVRLARAHALSPRWPDWVDIGTSSVDSPQTSLALREVNISLLTACLLLLQSPLPPLTTTKELSSRSRESSNTEEHPPNSSEMRPSRCLLCPLILALAVLAVHAAPATKNDVTDDLSPLNEKKTQVRATARVTARTPVRTTTEDIPEFDRNKVSLDVPNKLIGDGFTIITNLSKVISSLIMNSAKRTERVLEVFKPLFRGIFAIKGLPSDNEIK